MLNKVTDLINKYLVPLAIKIKSNNLQSCG